MLFLGGYEVLFMWIACRQNLCERLGVLEGGRLEFSVECRPKRNF